MSSRPHTRALATLAVATFALGVLLRLPTFSRPLLSDDEAIYATTADALVRGDLLYRDVVDHKPPLVYHVYRAGFAWLGHYNTHGAHALVILSVLLAAGLLLAIRRRESPVAAEGLAAAFLFLVFSTTWHDYDSLAANCELFLLAPQTAAAWLLLRDLGKPAPGAPASHLAVGLLIGVCALFKYQGLTFLGVSIGMLGWWVFLGRASWSRAAILALLQTVAALVPAALYLAWCAAAGNADAAVYWFRFNFSYVGAGLAGLAALARGLRRLGLVGGAALVPYALGISAAFATAAGVVRSIRRRWHGGRSSDTGEPAPSAVLGLLWLVTSASAVAAGGRFFGHYFHLILAPLCLLAAPVFCRLWNDRRSYRVALSVLCALPALFFFALATVGRPLAAALDEREPPYEGVASRIAALTAPEERIFVWGNSPQLYVLARRPMGARFSFCNYMTGESPGTPTESGQWDADRNQLPAAWDMLFADLEQRRPALLVDAAAAGWDGYEKYPLARYPRLRAYVARNYRPVEIRAAVVLYRRERTR
ncbi:MAG: hypothetical protein JXP73_18470 [Deltaproteobacteria bacterium]|nr:hypothetical protein [Deltaproteobacteria bacterium]